MTLAAPVAVFAALGDPNRSRLLELLSRRGRVSVSWLAGPLAVTRQAVKKHLDVLEGVGLVSAHRQGRELLYRLEPAVLEESAAWLQAAAARWDRSLAALKVAAEREPTE